MTTTSTPGSTSADTAMTVRLRGLVTDYLRVRRSLGYKLEYTERLLFGFVDYLSAVGAPAATVEHAVGFAMAPPGASPRWQALRLSAVRCFARGWTEELKGRKIRVNSMSPGPIETPALENAGLTAEQVKQAAAGFASQVPLGRRGKPEEVAAAVVFLASDESSYITGIDLAVDGGMAQV